MKRFQKIATIADLHFGRGSGSPRANQDNLDFLEWFIDKAQTLGVTDVIMLGDWHHNRFSLTLHTLDYSLKAMEMLSAAFSNIYFLTGNHDLMYREKRDVASTIFVKHVPNITLVNDPTVIQDEDRVISLTPWLVGDEKKTAKNTKSRYDFGHYELPGYLLNSRVPMPHHDTGLQATDFVHPEYVFSGHFHQKQHNPGTKVIYTGNIMPFDFSDSWEEERGFMTLEWGKEPEFHVWPDQPLFRTMKISDLVDNPGKYLKPKLTARVSLDLDISFEQAQFLKEELAKTFQLRRLELIPAQSSAHSSEEAQHAMEGVVFQTIDQIVLEGLAALDQKDYNSQILRDIYIELDGTHKRQ